MPTIAAIELAPNCATPARDLWALRDCKNLESACWKLIGWLCAETSSACDLVLGKTWSELG